MGMLQRTAGSACFSLPMSRLYPRGESATLRAELSEEGMQMKKQLPEILGKLRYIEFGAGSLSPQKKRELMESLPNTEIHNTW